MGRIGGMGRTEAPAATPSRGHANPRLGVSVSSRRAGVPNAAPALGWRRWGPAASGSKTGRIGRMGIRFRTRDLLYAVFVIALPSLASAQVPEKSCDSLLLTPRQVKGRAVGPK